MWPRQDLESWYGDTDSLAVLKYVGLAKAKYARKQENAEVGDDCW